MGMWRWNLTGWQATAPEGFVKEDLRLADDRMTPRGKPELMGYALLTGLILLMSLFSWVAGGEKWKSRAALLIHAAGYIKFMLLPHFINMY